MVSLRLRLPSRAKALLDPVRPLVGCPGLPLIGDPSPRSRLCEFRREDPLESLRPDGAEPRTQDPARSTRSQEACQASVESGIAFEVPAAGTITLSPAEPWRQVSVVVDKDCLSGPLGRPKAGGRTAKRPKELAVHRLAHRQSRLLVIVDPPPDPLPAALRSSARSPGTVPEIAPWSGSTVNVGPFGQDLE
jgi:hypothetical protein